MIHRRLLLGSALLAACGTPASSPDTVAPTSSSEATAALTPSAPKTGAELCAAFADRQRAAIDNALAPPAKPLTDGDTEMDEAAAKPILSALGGYCGATSKGAWATLIEAVTPRPWSFMGGLQARWTIVHLAADGTEKKISPDPVMGNDGWNYGVSMSDPAEMDVPALFDFDGDGEEELLVRFAGHIHEGESWVEAHLWTFRDGALKLYAPTDSLDFDAMEDVDKDGRPDLVGFGKYDTPFENCCSGFAGRVTGPSLVGHGTRDGGFSFTDDVAIGAATAACVGTPKPIVAPGKPWELGEVATRVVCARIQGRTATEIKAELDKAIPRSKAKDSCDTQKCEDPNAVRALLDAWADLAPPVQSPRAAKP